MIIVVHFLGVQFALHACCVMWLVSSIPFHRLSHIARRRYPRPSLYPINTFLPAIPAHCTSSSVLLARIGPLLDSSSHQAVRFIGKVHRRFSPQSISNDFEAESGSIARHIETPKSG